jgi:uncharacterized OsmC-like protein
MNRINTSVFDRSAKVILGWGLGSIVQRQGGRSLRHLTRSDCILKNMNAIIKWTGGVRFEAESRGHKVVSDQPVENGGGDQAMTPPELLLASLGTCAAYYALQYLRIHKLPADDLTIGIDADKALNPARLGTFRIHVESQAASDPKHYEGIMRAVKKCLIHNTLMSAPQIEIDMPVAA